MQWLGHVVNGRYVGEGLTRHEVYWHYISDTHPMTVLQIVLPLLDSAAAKSAPRLENRASGKHVWIGFENGKDALDRLKQEPFTLLLTDIVMPLMDGIELARRASELDPELKIMFITGFAAVTLNTDLQAPKDARVLSKPFHLKDLVREVDRLLAA